jgi:chromosome segregation and condensation protein ScpB
VTPTIRTPRQIARDALEEALTRGVITDYAVRPGGRATIYVDGGKFYTEHTLDTLATLKRIEKGEA